MPKTSVPALDSFDLAILAILQRDNTTPQRLIGEAVNLSAPAVQRRIRRMEETGVITANVAVVDPARVGQPITLIVEVEAISEIADLIDAAKREFAAVPEVQQCYYVTGEADFILVVVVSSMAEYEALTRRLFFGNNNVKRFRTFVAMDRVKVGSPHRCQAPPEPGNDRLHPLGRPLPTGNCLPQAEVSALQDILTGASKGPPSATARPTASF